MYPEGELEGTEDGTPTGKKVFDENGEQVRVPGKLKAVKGIGWFIEEYGVAQISYNLTNINITSMHVAFDEHGFPLLPSYYYLRVIRILAAARHGMLNSGRVLRDSE